MFCLDSHVFIEVSVNFKSLSTRFRSHKRSLIQSISDNKIRIRIESRIFKKKHVQITKRFSKNYSLKCERKLCVSHSIFYTDVLSNIFRNKLIKCRTVNESNKFSHCYLPSQYYCLHQLCYLILKNKVFLRSFVDKFN